MAMPKGLRLDSFVTLTCLYWLTYLQSCATLLLGVCLAELCFRNSAIEEMSSRSSASTICSGDMSLQIPLPQLPSRGNVFPKFRFHNSTLGYVFAKFCFRNSAIGEMSFRHSASTILPECLFQRSASTTPLWG